MVSVGGSVPLEERLGFGRLEVLSLPGEGLSQNLVGKFGSW